MRSPPVVEASSLTHTYSLYGLGVAVSGDAALLAALNSRLRQMPPDGATAPALAFEFQTVRDAANHTVEKPRGPGRLVYEPKVGGQVLHFDSRDQLYIEIGERVRALCDPAGGHTRVSIVQGAGDGLWLASHPLLTLPLMEALKRRGQYSLHAAGLSLNGRALLLAGGRGAGKSTLAITLLRAGFGFLGDDIVFLSRDDDGLRVSAFPDEIDVTDETVKLFPELRHLADRPRTPGSPKRQFRAEDVYRSNVVWESRPAALVFPGVADSDSSRLEPMDRDEALLELAPNVLLTEPSSSQAHLDALAQLIRESECYRLRTGRDLDALPRLLRGLAE